MQEKNIRTPSDAVSSMSVDLDMVDALMEGTSAMRLGGKKWLPQWPSEEDRSYQARLATAVLHPVFKRTVLVNASRPFSRKISLGEETPTRVLEWLPNIDRQGTSFPAYCNALMVHILARGLVGVLVEYPKADGVKSVADEKSAGVRPYCVTYPLGSILGWKTQETPAGLQLTELRLLEYVEKADGEYGTTSVEQVRLLTPGAWELFQQDKDKKWMSVEQGVTSLDFIPFRFFYGIRKAFGVGCSPLRDLAYQNVEHWQSASDQQTILHVSRVPILFAKCFGDAQITVGAGSAASSDNEHAELQYVEHTGAAIESGANALTQLEDRMRATGAELISLDPGFATATEVSADGEATRSLLQQICEHFEEGATEVLNFMALWVKEPPTASVEVYKDFGITSNSDAQALSSASNSGAISKQTQFEELQRRDIVSADRTWEDEMTRIQQDADRSFQEQSRQQSLAKPAPAQ